MDDNSLRTMASHETFISLLNLDPTPMETPPDAEKALPPLPEEQQHAGRPATTPTGLGLSGSGHGAVYFCQLVSASPPR